MTDEMVTIRRKVVAQGGGRVMVKASLAPAQDVYTILNRYRETGGLPMYAKSPQYGDFTGLGDYHEAWNKVAQAQSSFAALPANVRTHFRNDPEAFLRAVYDPRRRDELVELGLIEGKLEAAVPPGAKAVQEKAAAEPEAETHTEAP